ncbi:hypothetical protein LAG90_05340 [Marinilongibacter aquaticus]|nr:hypothetical protein [Marinilongibacter aquaticus]UBM60066.1 hypothetical protein LAG90_05340 [Marinilongibacter aquaticus]
MDFFGEDRTYYLPFFLHFGFFVNRVELQQRIDGFVEQWLNSCIPIGQARQFGIQAVFLLAVFGFHVPVILGLDLP